MLISYFHKDGTPLCIICYIKKNYQKRNSENIEILENQDNMQESFHHSVDFL